MGDQNASRIPKSPTDRTTARRTTNRCSIDAHATPRGADDRRRDGPTNRRTTPHGHLTWEGERVSVFQHEYLSPKTADTQPPQDWGCGDPENICLLDIETRQVVSCTVHFCSKLVVLILV